MLLSAEKNEFAAKDANIEFDVFVSHASEDKNAFANKFVKELRKRGLRVWYDTDQIRWGDSVREKIDDGIKKSRFVAVVLSPNYFLEEKYWTKYELDSSLQFASCGTKTLLPVWHNLTHQDVMNYCPGIAGRLAMLTKNMSPAKMAQELKQLI